MPILSGFRKSLANFIYPGSVQNAFSRAFYQLTGQAYTAYDTNGPTYLYKGFLSNPTVNAVVRQRSEKAKSIPMTVKRVKSGSARGKLQAMRMATKGIIKGHQLIRQAVLEAKAFDEEALDWPMEKPNELQTWGEIVALYDTFMSITGNFYLYVLSPSEDGKGEPYQVYVLPSHMISIILKADAQFMGVESPIEKYRLITGGKFSDFPAESVIHVKTPNPEYGLNGEHLYGLSPLRAALRNIQSSNEAIDSNIRTLLNSGSFGFIHGKQVPLTQEQAVQIKDKLVEMRSNDEVLSHIQGASAELGFTRINLTTKELMPFDYLGFDEKQICNVLGWDNKLLNNDEGAKYDNVEWAERRVLVNTVMPSLQLLAEALTDRFLTRFQGYEGAVVEFDYSEVPEMQIDVAEMVGWLKESLDRGVITRNEFRQAIKYPALDDDLLNTHTVTTDIISLEEAINNDLFIDEPGGIQE